MGLTDKQLADLIWQTWQTGDVIGDLPDDAKPHSRAHAYAVQVELERHSCAPRAGWKIAATSAAGQKHINVDGPLAGRILAEKVLAAGATASLTGNRMLVAEPEFAFRFGQAVPSRGTPYSTDEVMALVSDLHLAIELPDSRFEDFTIVGAPALIVDNACARDLVLGAAVTADWRGIDLSRHEVRCTVGARYTREGIGSNVLGDPRDALTWCVNELSALGVEIAAGEFITTGTCAIPMEIEVGDQVTADFGLLGQISVTLTS